MQKQLLKQSLRSSRKVKLSGLATDGASVMLGKENGVAVKLKERNPKLINIHCICHKLALAYVDTVSELNYIKFIETTLRQLWQWLENSPIKRMAAFQKVQINLKSTRNVTDKATKVIARRLKKACSTLAEVRQICFCCKVRIRKLVADSFKPQVAASRS